MSEKDEKREQPEVEGHMHLTDEPGELAEDPKSTHGWHLQETDDDKPDFEGHKHKSPVRKHK